MTSRFWMAMGMVVSFGLGMTVQAEVGAAAQKDKAVATGIGGVFFKTKDPAATAKWYREHLGIELAPAGKSPTAMQYHVFEWGGKDSLGRDGSTVFSIFADTSKYFDPTTAPFTIDFRVTNLEKLMEQLKAEGVTVDPKIQGDDTQGKFGWVTDPDGRRIELWEPK
jgi:catechol 2,3-dioxygenase-like lactoylglutathione lyase family enzyme